MGTNLENIDSSSVIRMDLAYEINLDKPSKFGWDFKMGRDQHIKMTVNIGFIIID